MPSLRWKLLDIMLEQGWSQREAAAAFGVNQGHISRLMAGQRQAKKALQEAIEARHAALFGQRAQIAAPLPVMLAERIAALPEDQQDALFKVIATVLDAIDKIP